MENDLFSSSQPESWVREDQARQDFYDKVMEKRMRPKIEGQGTLVLENLEASAVEKTVSAPQWEPRPLPTRVYSYEEALASSTAYFKGDDLAAKVWINKYALKDTEGNLYELNPDDMHHRIASELARIERHYPNPLSEQEIYELLKDFRYIIPQGSPMAGIGNDFQVVSLSNCFVIGNEGSSDSYGAILKIDQEQVQLM